jgi:hypothetical protein
MEFISANAQRLTVTMELIVLLILAISKRAHVYTNPQNVLIVAQMLIVLLLLLLKNLMNAIPQSVILPQKFVLLKLFQTKFVEHGALNNVLQPTNAIKQLATMITVTNLYVMFQNLWTVTITMTVL